MLRVIQCCYCYVSPNGFDHDVDGGKVLVNLPYYKVNDERLCRSTQWVVSLNTALSPSSYMVIQDKECNHTLGSLTPLDLVPHPISNPRSRISLQVLVGLWHGLRSGRTATQTAWDPAHIV